MLLEVRCVGLRCSRRGEKGKCDVRKTITRFRYGPNSGVKLISQVSERAAERMNSHLELIKPLWEQL